MKLPKIKLKKVPYYLTLGLLTSGASVILGFLSFGGMLALSSVLPLALPALPLAVAAFALSVGYEGEIYLQNIKGALNKLFKHNYMKRRLADEYLLALFTDSNFDINLADCPQFFKDYAAQCGLLSQFEHKTLNKEDAARKKQAEKTLNDMEKWFARQLIAEDENNTLVGDDYQKELQHWLRNPPEELIARRLADKYLLALFPDSNFDINVVDCPQFFKDYAAKCQLFSQLEHETLDKASADHKKQVERTLNDMKEWFARQLMTKDKNDILVGDDDQKELQNWLSNPPKELMALRQKELVAFKQSEWVSRFQARKIKFNLFKIFGSLSALFMGLGTTYLLVEAFGAIPWLSISAATLPFLIVPMAVIAGLAYGLLTYNAITDMLTNNKVRAMYLKLKANLSRKNWTWHDVTMAATGVALGALALLLTICTAGTWWTVAKNTQPLFAWVGKLPSVVMGVINPIITGISALVFNMQNSAESLEIIAESTEPEENRCCLMSMSEIPEKNDALHALSHSGSSLGYIRVINEQNQLNLLYYVDARANCLTKLKIASHVLEQFDHDIPYSNEPYELSVEQLKSITSLTRHAQSSSLQRLKDAFARLNEKENKWQVINPFRVLLKLTIAPLRVLLFLGHLISIGLTADRVPGVPEIVSAILGIVSEGFEDLHYFVGHGHHHNDHCEHHHEDPLKSFIKNRLSLAHGHNHDADLPTKILLLIFSPIYAMAAVWDWASSWLGSNPITFERAWEKQHLPTKILLLIFSSIYAIAAVWDWASSQLGSAPITLKQARDKQHGILPKEQETSVDLSQQSRPSAKWQVEHAVYRIERHKEKQLNGALINSGLAREKREALTALQDKLLDSSNTADCVSVQKCIMSEPFDLYNQHRFFGSADRGETRTSQFLNELPARVCSPG